VAAQGLRGLKEGKKCEMIWLRNNWRHGPTDQALGVGGIGRGLFFQLVRVLVVEQCCPLTKNMMH